MTTKAILYGRFSPRPNSEECESVEKQLDQLALYCGALNIEVIAQYYDKDLSGARADNRPGFQKACAHAIQEKAALVVTALDRLARNTKDAIETLDRLGSRGADIVSIQENIDTTKPIGKFVFTLMSALAQMQRENISIATSTAMQKHQANGVRMSSKLPYGWRQDPDNGALMIEDEDEQDAIDTIVSLHVEGEGLRAICRQLDEMGIAHRNGTWHHQQVKAIIQRAGA